MAERNKKENKLKTKYMCVPLEWRYVELPYSKNHRIPNSVALNLALFCRIGGNSD
jgi:hypothetical protein